MQQPRRILAAALLWLAPVCIAAGALAPSAAEGVFDEAVLEAVDRGICPVVTTRADYEQCLLLLGSGDFPFVTGDLEAIRNVTRYALGDPGEVDLTRRPEAMSRLMNHIVTNHGRLAGIMLSEEYLDHVNRALKHDVVPTNAGDRTIGNVFVVVTCVRARRFGILGQVPECASISPEILVGE